jgi:ribosomal protein S18 acetylase RimI-like enzyme
MSLTIRSASAEDLAEVGKLAAALVRQHYDFDPLRFILIPNPEAGYARFLRGQLDDDASVVLVAERDGLLVGYAYARVEARDWNALLDKHGALHDIYVAEPARRTGIARALALAVCGRLKDKGAPRVVLHTASPNAGAQRFFKSLGFRETMLEMTRELP